MPVSRSLTFLVAPVRNRGERVGTIFLAEKEGGREFTAEDEETLVMFASQAALVISNARRYLDEQRARADLETLIATSPVGVVVLDAKTGEPVSFNREAARIVEDIRPRDCPPEKLLEVMNVRRADGREVSLNEVTIAQALSTGEKIRAEEVVFKVPDGGAVTVLINATPIISDDEQPGFLCRNAPGHDTIGGSRADASRIPRHGQPRTEGAIGGHKGFRRNGFG